MARVALWRRWGESSLGNTAGGPRGDCAEQGFLAGLGAGAVSSGIGQNNSTDSGRPGWRHHAAPLGLGTWTAPSVEGALSLGIGRGVSAARGPGPRCSERARACEGGELGPRHDQFLGTRVGEASNPGPAPFGPWDPDPAFTSQFATCGEGWVVFFGGDARPRREFNPFLQGRGPLGWQRDDFPRLRGEQLFLRLNCGAGLRLCRGKTGPAPLGGPGSQTALVGVRMAPSGLAWTTGDPKREGDPWTHADLACGIGGFTVAAHAVGATTTWACDVNRTAVNAYNAAHGRGHARPAECHPIELRTRWSKHVGRT